MLRRTSTFMALCLILTTLALTTAQSASATAGGRVLPSSIPLPNGFRPEGLTIGRGTTFYVGSRLDGAVYRGDLVTGRGAILVPGTAGTAKTGLKVDARNR